MLLPSFQSNEARTFSRRSVERKLLLFALRLSLLRHAMLGTSQSSDFVCHPLDPSQYDLSKE